MRLLRTGLILLAFGGGVAASAQISITTAVDLAVRSSAKVRVAMAEVDKARAGVAEAKDVYVPSVNGGAGLGDSFGYSTNPPTLFTVTAASLVYSSAQIDYIRAAQASLAAATLSLKDAQEAVAEDAVLTFVALEHDQDREAALNDEAAHSARLIAIVQDRLDAGRDTQMDFVSAKLSAANLRLSRVHQQTQTANDRQYLARLTGLPATALRVEGGLPAAPPTEMLVGPDQTSPAVGAAFANAHAKQEQAFGDSRFRYRPQVNLFVQYSRYATFADSFKQLETAYSTNNNNNKIGANEEAFGVQITLPFFDRGRASHARNSAAEARRAYAEAQQSEFLALDGRARLKNSMAELQARIEVAALEQEYSQLQLDAMLVQLNAPTGSGPQMTPKDEQNARIQEREKYLSVIDTTFTLRQAQINLLRQSGQLGEWLKTANPPSPQP